jgi:hypothetical protein
LLLAPQRNWPGIAAQNVRWPAVYSWRLEPPSFISTGVRVRPARSSRIMRLPLFQYCTSIPAVRSPGANRRISLPKRCAVFGHSQIALTMNTYGHVFLSIQREAASKMDEILSRVAVKEGLEQVQ